MRLLELFFPAKKIEQAMGSNCEAAERRKSAADSFIDTLGAVAERMREEDKKRGRK